MDYYSSLNSVKNANKNLDFYSQQLLSTGSNAVNNELTELRTDLENEYADIRSNYSTLIEASKQGQTTEALQAIIRDGGLEAGGAFVKKLPANIRQAKEVGSKVIETGKETLGKVQAKAGELVEKASSKAEKLSREATSKYNEIMRTENLEPKQTELSSVSKEPIAEGRGELPSRSPMEMREETKEVQEVSQPSRELEGVEPLNATKEQLQTNPLRNREIRDAPLTEVAETGEVAETAEIGALAETEELGAEVAVAGALDPVADVVGGTIMLAGLALGAYDLFSGKDKKEERKERDLETQAEIQQSRAEADVAEKATALQSQYKVARQSITSNTHQGVVLGVSNVRNNYKSSGTF
jgi:hypothetical protein